MIPRIVHFVYFHGGDARPFSLINYIAVRSAKDWIDPEKIVMHTNEDISGNLYWDAIKPFVTVNIVTPPTHWHGRELKYVQYKSDVVRLLTLYNHGGVYLDSDMLMVGPIDDLFDEQFVMGKESDGALSGGFIMSQPGSSFVVKWLDQMGEGLDSGIWAYHCVTTSWEVAKAHPKLIKILPRSAIMPFDLSRNWLFDEPAQKLPIGSISVHVWETFWRDYIKHVNLDYLKKGNSLFCELFRHYAEGIENEPDIGIGVGVISNTGNGSGTDRVDVLL